MFFRFVVELSFSAAVATESEDLDQWLAEVEAGGNLPGDSLEIKKIPVNVLHRFATGADKMVMRVQVSIHTKSGGVRRDLTQEAALHE